MTESKTVTLTNAPTGGTYAAPTLCQNCGKRPATQNWVGEGGTLAFTHNMYRRWCELCCTEYQLEYARKAAARIPELEKKLEELKSIK